MLQIGTRGGKHILQTNQKNSQCDTLRVELIWKFQILRIGSVAGSRMFVSRNGDFVVQKARQSRYRQIFKSDETKSDNLRREDYQRRPG